MDKGKKISRLGRLLGERKKAAILKPRIAQRRVSDMDGLYKVLDRDIFYARHYEGIKNPMTLMDISTTGCAFKTEYAIAKGAYLEIELMKLSQQFTFEAPVIVACETIYCLPLEKPNNRIGAKFVEINWKDVEKIRLFTEKSRFKR